MLKAEIYGPEFYFQNIRAERRLHLLFDPQWVRCVLKFLLSRTLSDVSHT